MMRSEHGEARVGLLAMAADASEMRACAELLEDRGLACEMWVASAHRVPNLGQRWLAGARERGVGAIVAALGSAPHLPHVARLSCDLPVAALRVGPSANCAALLPADVIVAEDVAEAVQAVLAALSQRP